MKQHRWTLALASLGVISLASVTYAEEQAMSQVLTAVSSTTVSGYVDVSGGWKLGGTGGGDLPGRFNDGMSKMQGFDLGVAGVSIGKPLSEEELWAAGYQVDLLFGPDAVGYNPVSGSVFPNTAGDDSTAELAIKQAYVNLLVPIGNGLDVKAGVFNTIIGYESFESHANPNWGRSFGWQIEPTQHTGVLASYQLTEAVSASAGLANTWVWGVDARGLDDKGYLAYLASLGITAPDSWGALSGSSFTVGVVGGDSDPSNNSATYVNSFYAGFNLLTGLEGFSVGGAFDYQDAADAYYVWALAGYASFAATEKLTLNARLDYTRGSAGYWYGAADGNRDELFALTGTLDYQLWDNVLSRLELRWDTCLSDDTPYADADKNAVTLAANLVYMF